MPESLTHLLPFTFANSEALKMELLTTAAKMFGNGWVWLVLDQKKNLRILATYNAGTPYGSAYRRQETDMNTNQKLGISEPEVNITKVTQEAARGSTLNWALPLLNINVWQHAYIEDFGVAGKEEYLEAVWKAIDWNVVAGRLPSNGATGGVTRNMFNN